MKKDKLGVACENFAEASYDLIRDAVKYATSKEADKIRKLRAKIKSMSKSTQETSKSMKAMSKTLSGMTEQTIAIARHLGVKPPTQTPKHKGENV